jgi:hypothetical protein
VLAPASISMPLALDRPGLATLPAAGARVDDIDVLRRDGRRRAPAHGFRLARKRVVGHAFTLFRFRSRTPRLITPTGLLGDDPVRRRRTAVMLAPPIDSPGARRSEPPVLRFCGPAPRDVRARVSIRTPCAAAYPP